MAKPRSSPPAYCTRARWKRPHGSLGATPRSRWWRRTLRRRPSRCARSSPRTSAGLEGSLKASVLVFEGRGFQAATIRAAVAGLAFLSGSRQTVVSTVEEGARIVVEKLGLAAPTEAAATLVAQVAKLRQQ
ncbi:MAG: hypothetical protein QM765_11000 [Myxococcales bacterium]